MFYNNYFQEIFDFFLQLLIQYVQLLLIIKTLLVITNKRIKVHYTYSNILIIEKILIEKRKYQKLHGYYNIETLYYLYLKY